MTDFTDESHIRHAARRLIEEFDAMPDSPLKVALAQELFGKDWLGVLWRLTTARAKYLGLTTAS